MGSEQESRFNRRFIVVGGVLLIAIAAAMAVVVPTLTVGDQTQVTLLDDGTEVATVDAEVADTSEAMYTGLSNHDSLGPGEGMVFLHRGDTSERTYVMRNMSFDIDMVFIDADCEVTAVHHAEAPLSNESGMEPQYRYSGQAKYVLEVAANSVADSIEAGDSARIANVC